MLSEFQKQVRLAVTQLTSTTILLEDELTFDGPPAKLQLYVVPMAESINIQGFANREAYIKAAISRFREGLAHETSFATRKGQTETNLGWIRYTEPYEGVPTHETTILLFPTQLSAEYQAALDHAATKFPPSELIIFPDLKKPIPSLLLTRVVHDRFPTQEAMRRIRALSDR